MHVKVPVLLKDLKGKTPLDITESFAGFDKTILEDIRFRMEMEKSVQGAISAHTPHLDWRAEERIDELTTQIEVFDKLIGPKR